MQTAEKRYSESEYLARERAREGRWEYVDGLEYAMSGASAPHNDIVMNLATLVNVALRPRGCRARCADQRLKVNTRYYYPDLVAFCGQGSYQDDAFNTLIDARLVIEVLSFTTEKVDRVEKFDAYGKLASLLDYVLVDSMQVRIEHFHREQVSDPWTLRVGHAGERLVIAALGIDVAVDAIYEGVQIDPDADR